MAKSYGDSDNPAGRTPWAMEDEVLAEHGFTAAPTGAVASPVLRWVLSCARGGPFGLLALLERFANRFLALETQRSEFQ